MLNIVKKWGCHAWSNNDLQVHQANRSGDCVCVPMMPTKARSCWQLHSFTRAFVVSIYPKSHPATLFLSPKRTDEKPKIFKDAKIQRYQSKAVKKGGNWEKVPEEILIKRKTEDSRRRNFSRSPRTLDKYTRKTKKKKNKYSYNGRTG